jgi:type IV pilus assembly protein PilN
MIRVNLLGVPRAKRRARAPMVTMEGWKPLILLLIVIVAVAVAESWRYQKLQAEGDQLGKDIASLEREKAELGRIRGEYDTFSKRKELLTSRIGIIETLKKQQSGPVQLLSTLASAVAGTDSLWLTSFERTGQKINIEGVALNVKAVADFLTRLHNSKAFADLDLKESAQTNAKDMQTFVFTITGELASSPPAQAGPGPA